MGITGMRTFARGRRMLLLGTMIAAAGLASCEKENLDAKVDVTYRQLTVFRLYTIPGGEGTATGNADAGEKHVFVLYKIVGIRNQGKQAVAYKLDRTRISTVQDQMNLNDAATHEANLLGKALLPSNITVNAGENKTSGLGCIILRAALDWNYTKDTQIKATGYKIDLFHQLEAKQPVKMEREAGNNTFTVNDPSKAEHLQAECG
jgi:hypothetical protein